MWEYTSAVYEKTDTPGDYRRGCLLVLIVWSGIIWRGLGYAGMIPFPYVQAQGSL